ncbi:MAG: L,D-transpeptidase, partial [Anaerolineaceae bacterium]
MRRLFKVLSLCLLLGMIFPQNHAVSAQNAPVEKEPYAGKPLCLPDAYLNTPADCLPLGPSSYLTRMAQSGIPYPQRSLPAATPDPALSQIPALYARIGLDDSQPAPIYATQEDAVASINPVRYLDAGPFRYVSYIQEVEVNGGHYVQLASGEWMRASPAAYSHFQGLVFRETPRNNFGWIVEPVVSRTGPGYEFPETGKSYALNTVVQVYKTEQKDKLNWIMIGMDEWIEWRYVRSVYVNTTPPEGVKGDRWIEVNIFEETLSVYENRQLVFATLITSGSEPFFTRPGTFQVYQKKEFETMQGSFESNRSDFYYLEKVPWTMYFDKARALHGAYWRTKFGFQASHGCV